MVRILDGNSVIGAHVRNEIGNFIFFRHLIISMIKCSELTFDISTVCPGSSDPPEKTFNTFASEIAVYTIYKLLPYFRLNIICLQSKIM